MAGLGQAGAIWLDVTRLVTRAGRGVLTGIDRVELAYLDHLLDTGDADARFLLRSTRGYLLLDRRGGAHLADLVTGRAVPGPADRLSRLLGKGSDPRHRVEAALRPHAIDSCLATRMPWMIARAARGPLWYLNTGHSNLAGGALAAFSRHRGARIGVLIHDLIPITHPDLVAPGMTARFARRLDQVRAHADLVICNSAVTAGDLAGHWQGAPHVPPRIVAHLGLSPQRRSDTPRDPRHVVMLGTIEPRKNHALMLDVWEMLAARMSAQTMPQLHIIGPTGWNVAALMNRLKTHSLLGRAIHLHGALSDAAVADHLARARALVFPSLAEGYGYPPLEAALAGAQPICSDLPVFRETLGNTAVYVAGQEAYSWMETIQKHIVDNNQLPTHAVPDAPGWVAHFAIVGAALAHG